MTHSAVPPSFYSRELLLAFSGGEYADFLAGGGRQLRPRLTRALELANLSPGMRVVDIGCGRGEITLHAARRGAVVTAVDFSAECLELTSATLALGPPDASARVHLSCADATALPVPDDSVHRVFFLDVAEHLRPWQLRQALAEVRRVLRPDGYTIIHTLPNRWALNFGYPLMRWLWPHLPAEPRSEYEKQVHVNELDPLQLSRALEEAGLHSRVWLENWTMVHARWAEGRRFADELRDRSYPVLRRWWIGPLTAAIMHTPLRLILANDIFALAWPRGGTTPACVWPRGWVEQAAKRLREAGIL